MKIKTIIGAMLLLAVTNLQAFLVPSNPPPVVQLAWTLSPGMTYNIYYGVGSGQYTNKVPIGQTNYAAITLPARGIQYFFACTATSTNSGLESVFSVEVSATPALPPPAPSGIVPPVMLTIQYKSTPQDFLWSDLFNYSLDPTASNQLFRLEIASLPLAQKRAIAKTKGIALPPTPGL
jgi:hypothetical protein